MDILDIVKEIIAGILDMEKEEIKRDSYLIRELGVESIDLLELSVELNSAFQIDVNEDEIFLQSLRLYLNEARETNKEETLFLKEQYPFLTDQRIREVLSDLEDGPVLKVNDILSYVAWKTPVPHG